MRKVLLSLASAALRASACRSSAMPASSSISHVRASNPYFRLDAFVSTTAELVRGSELASARWTIRDVADVANREAELLPANDEVHAFLDMLSNLGRLRN